MGLVVAYAYRPAMSAEFFICYDILYLIFYLSYGTVCVDFAGSRVLMVVVTLADKVIAAHGD